MRCGRHHEFDLIGLGSTIEMPTLAARAAPEEAWAREILRYCRVWIALRYVATSNVTLKLSLIT